MPRDYASDLGSARVSRVSERVLANTCRMNALGRVDDRFSARAPEKSTQRRVRSPEITATFLVEPVHFDQRDSDRVVDPAHDGGVVART